MNTEAFKVIAAMGAVDRATKELRAENDRLRAVLAFYANPFNQRDEDGEPVRVPDFYNEMDFGAKAFEALTTK